MKISLLDEALAKLVGLNISDLDSITSDQVPIGQEMATPVYNLWSELLGLVYGALA